MSTYDRCSECRNLLPCNDRGYCQRCETGWDGFIDLEVATEPEIQRELELAYYAQGSYEIRGKVYQPLDNYIEKLQKFLRDYWTDSADAV